MEFTEWLRMTSLSVAIQGNAYWLWPTCESVHFIGLSMSVGATGLFDFRLMGFWARRSENDPFAARKVIHLGV
jgi:hypothetical protein